jgi:hypothetical protein
MTKKYTQVVCLRTVTGVQHGENDSEYKHDDHDGYTSHDASPRLSTKTNSQENKTFEA